MASNKPIIYKFFKSVPSPESYVIKDNNKKYNSWQCLSSWCKKIVTIEDSTNSNLATHLLSAKHKEENQEYEKLKADEEHPNKRSKRKLIREDIVELTSMGIIKNTTPAKPKYDRNHPRQLEA
jgi:hypothetical protein